MKLPIIDNQVALTSDADAASDVFLGGVRYENSATPKVRATTVSGQYQANGLSFDATGRVFYTDATAGLPAGTTFAGGLPFSPSGALCVSSGPVSTWGNGIPFAANGAVSALFASPNTITPVISTSRTTGVAPLSVTFDALTTTAPVLTSLPFSEIYYAWTFGDPAGGATWAYGTRPGVYSKNEAIGPVASHVFETDGSYTVTCWAFYLTNLGVLWSGSTTTTITVTNADTVFASNTIYISSSGTPVPGSGGVPPGANVQQVTNWAIVATLAQTYKRILLRRGDTWVVTAVASLNQASQNGAGIIGAYGSGNRPLLQLNYDGVVLLASSVVSDWRIVDLDIDAINIVSRTFATGFELGGAANILVLRTDVKNVKFGVNTDANDGLYFADCVIGPMVHFSGNAAYGMYVSRVNRFGMLGTRVFGASTHAMRIQGGTRVAFDSSTFDEAIVGTPGHALTVRGWSPYTGSEWTEYVVISRCVMTSNANSLVPFTVMPQNTTEPERIRNVIVDGCFVRGDTTNPADFSVSTGLTVRNSIFIGIAGGPINIRGQNTAGSPHPSQNFFYNNTYYLPATGGWVPVVFEITGTVSGIVLTNNLAHVPNFPSSQLTNGTGGQVTLANNSSDSQIKNVRPWAAATPGTTPAAAADFTPSGSYAVDGGTWVPVYKNYFATTASGTREIGAI